MDMKLKQEYEVKIDTLLKENVELRAENKEARQLAHTLRVELFRTKVDPTYNCM